MRRCYIRCLSGLSAVRVKPWPWLKLRLRNRGNFIEITPVSVCYQLSPALASTSSPFASASLFRCYLTPSNRELIKLYGSWLDWSARSLGRSQSRHGCNASYCLRNFSDIWLRLWTNHPGWRPRIFSLCPSVFFFNPRLSQSHRALGRTRKTTVQDGGWSGSDEFCS